jgi:hypothetical protein
VTARATLAFLVLAGGLAACRRAPAPPVPAASSSAAPATSAVLLEPPPAESTVTAGPAPSGATRLQREQAVISLLRGQLPSDRFPVVATDDGGAVDPKLREVLAPREKAADGAL